MATTTASLSYMDAREVHIRARAKLQHHQESLMAALCAADTGASLETAMLAARGKGLFTAEIIKLSELETALDRASDALDLATERQRRRVTSKQAILNSIHKNFDE